MNRSSRRITKKQAESKARRSMTWVHVLIAVVAIIECVLLVTFTTFSWIESNSSLIIQNGPESSQVEGAATKKMDITGRLKSTINLNYTGDDFAPLNDFFSEVKYFEFAQATSSDGRTLFFPCRNNTYSEAGKYRKSDTVDYNTSFLYFDFVMSNRDPSGDVVANRDVYFSAAEGYTDFFTVTGGDDLTPEQKTALINAMRMSITTQSGSSAPSTKIFAKTEHSGETTSYKSFDEIPAGQSFAYDENGGEHDNNRNTWVDTKVLSDYVYRTNSSNVVESEKIFVVKKNAETKVSVRIWFDCWDPGYRAAFGLDGLNYAGYENSSAAYWKIPDATIGIKFKLMTSGNDLRSIYFDDYTLTNQSGINVNHLTDENSSYSVWFYTWQPGVAATSENPEHTAGYYAIPLTRDSSDSVHTLWSANTATASEMEYLMGEGDYSTTSSNATGYSGSVANRYQKSYFCYGDFSTKTAIYKWELPAAPQSEDFTFNAYSYLPNSSTNKTSHAWTTNGSGLTWWDCNGTGVKSGVGIWQDDADSSMTLLKFRDYATVLTDNSYNGGSNCHIMRDAAIADNHTHYLVYANNYNSDTLANNFTADVEKITAAMYYDASAQVFKSYVPTGWLTDTDGVSFTYCPGGTFSSSDATMRWYSGASAAVTNGGEYLYTALGCSNRYGLDTLAGVGYMPTFYSSSAGFLKGVGTWQDVELIQFSTDLIDDSINHAYRYFVGINDSYSCGYYPMYPDATHMLFSAFIPAEQGKTAPGVKFARMDAVKLSQDDTAESAHWYGNTRGTYSIFYPVDCDGTSGTEVYTHGYWNVSVLVDGTYENLIYDTLTDGGHDAGDDPIATYDPVITAAGSASARTEVDYSARINYGKLEFSFTGQEGSWYTVCDDTTDTLSYSSGSVAAGTIDRYRFFVNAENQNAVYWRWTPYKGYSITIYKTWDSTVGESGGYVEETIVPGDTVFTYAHDVSDTASDGIYLVVTEAPSVVDLSQ